MCHTHGIDCQKNHKKLYPVAQYKLLCDTLVLNEVHCTKLISTIYNVRTHSLFHVILRNSARPACLPGGLYDVLLFFLYYIRQVNGVKLADILFSLLCVCVCLRTQSSLQQCVSHNASAISLMQVATHLPWWIYALSERLLVYFYFLKVPLETNHLRMYWTDLYQIVRLGS